jgi:tetratricopeptide (TPR) repeat protein
MSQQDLAAGNYSAAYISHLEKGRRSPSPDALDHIAQRLGVAADYLLTGRDPDLDLRLQLAVDRAIARIHAGELQAAHDELQDIHRRAAKQHFLRAASGADHGLGLIAQRQGRWEDALDHFQRAEALLGAEPPEARTPLVTARGRCLFAMNAISHAIHVLETHLVELSEAGSPDPTALLQVYSALIGPYFEAGFKERAASVAQDAHGLEARVQDPEHLACLNINRAQILLEDGHRDAAMRSLARAEDLFKQIGWRDAAAKAAVAQATAAVETGDLTVGQRQALAALAELEHTPSTLDKARTLNLLARIERLRKRPRDALAHLDTVGKVLGGRRSMEQAWRLREAALCHIDIGDSEAAHELLHEALEIYRTAKAPDQVATTAAYLGDVLRALGRTEEAVGVYRAALAQVEDLAV